MNQILIVDDDPVMQLLLSKTLIKNNYSVSVAQDGKEGLKKALELKPALILSDWSMPILNGIELCKEVRKKF